MSTKSFSKLAALGITAVFWPIFFFVEGVFIKKFFPYLFYAGGGGIRGVGEPVRVDHTSDYTIGGLILVSLVSAAVLALIIYTAENRRRTDAQSQVR